MIYLLLVVFALAAPAAAQDSLPANTCDQQEAIDSLSTVFAALTPGDTFAATLQMLQHALAITQWTCADFILSGEPDGRDSIVIGPYTLPEGLYKMTITSEDSILIQSERISGRCDLISEFLSKGEAVNGSEYLTASETCTLFFVVSANAAWEVRFDKLA